MSEVVQSDLDIFTTLVNNGWKESPNITRKYSRCFYKRFDTPSCCFENNDKPGVQLQIAVSTWQDTSSMELELCAGLPDGTWLALLNYGLPHTVEAVEKLIPRMLHMWEAANTITQQNTNA